MVVEEDYGQQDNLNYINSLILLIQPSENSVLLRTYLWLNSRCIFSDCIYKKKVKSIIIVKSSMIRFDKDF